eukprot:m.61865 g.61865  ORF g.61865 m.61865 type:complete len:326 (+) comp9584_c0_seq2:1344-2321(+)
MADRKAMTAEERAAARAQRRARVEAIMGKVKKTPQADTGSAAEEPPTSPSPGIADDRAASADVESPLPSSPEPMSPEPEALSPEPVSPTVLSDEEIVPTAPLETATAAEASPNNPTVEEAVGCAMDSDTAAQLPPDTNDPPADAKGSTTLATESTQPVTDSDSSVSASVTVCGDVPEDDSNASPHGERERALPGQEGLNESAEPPVTEISTQHSPEEVPEEVDGLHGNGTVDQVSSSNEVDDNFSAPTEASGTSRDELIETVDPTEKPEADRLRPSVDAGLVAADDKRWRAFERVHVDSRTSSNFATLASDDSRWAHLESKLLAQ